MQVGHYVRCSCRSRQVALPVRALRLADRLGLRGQKLADAAVVNAEFPNHHAAMQRKWKPGDLVVVVTFNRGEPLGRARKAPKSGKAETWTGEIVGPSVLWPNWWNVRRDTPSGGRRGGSVFAVPDGEIMPRKR